MEPSARTFRTRAILRVALAAAGGFWAACFVGMRRFGDLAPPATVWGCLVFALFFGVLWAYHARLRIAVDGRGLRYRGLRKTVDVDFADILRVNVVPTGIVRVYTVVTRQGMVFFSSNVKGHRELLQLLVDGARLAGRA